MGCCQSTEDDNGRGGESGSLLPSDAERRTARLEGSLTHGTGGNNYGATDEEGRLNQILQKTAENLIDVADVAPHSLDHSEVAGRTREYNQRVSAWRTGVSHSAAKLPASSTQPHVVLSRDLVPDTDIGYISDKAETLEQALGSMEVDVGDPVVVPFTTT